VFHEITEKAVKHAVANPRRLDMNRANAQQARAMLDMMIGFTISPLLWKSVAPSLSAGRCQTPALRLVVEREEAIHQFKSSSSWQLSATFQKDSFSIHAIMTDELEDEESSLNYMENVHTIKEGIIEQKMIKPWTQGAPPPLITSTLQQQASALFGLNPKSTMKIAQRLYEAGHITYMRTDQAVLSEEAVQEAKAYVQEHYGPTYISSAESKKSKKDPLKQEAHEAIRPTHMDTLEVEGDALEKKVYRLIWQRAIQSVMSPAKGETCTVQIKLEEDFMWQSTWKRTTFEGWKKAGKVVDLDESDEEESQDWDNAVALALGDHLTWTTMKAEPKETKASGRYSEATLVRELEAHGIGRPSTFASLLSAIQEKNYVETKDIPPKELTLTEFQMKPQEWPPLKHETKKKVGGEKKKMVPTELGRSVWGYLKTTFADLFAYEFTAQMEQRLDRVSNGQEEWKGVLQDMWNSYQARYETLNTNAKQAVNAKIKEFGNGLKAVQTKNGPLLLIEGKTKKDTVFIGWPKGILFEDITEEQATQFQPESSVGEWNGQPIVKKSGKFGAYLQCGDLSVPFQEEPLEQTIERLEAKKGSGPLKTFKEYVIRTGQYGPYIMKTSLKKAKFVSLPKGINPENLTEKEVEALYKLGLESKKNKKKE
jgi:DNA topoisomerase-1